MRRPSVRAADGLRLREQRQPRAALRLSLRTRHLAAARRARGDTEVTRDRSEEHTSELQSRGHLVCRLLLEKKNLTDRTQVIYIYAAIDEPFILDAHKYSAYI